MRKTEEIFSEVLRNRGLTAEEDISEFLSDRPQRTYDPFLLFNMRAGVGLLLSEINSGSRICIYGDYDADGVTSVCILSHVLGMLTDNITYYIPSRFHEGYGLNKEAISRIRDDGTRLIVTVDCGSVSYEEVEYAKELGMKVIVTDHHNIDDIKADCILINPRQKECSYPFKELAGCGVAFKLAQAIRNETGLPKTVINDILDLTALGTVADIVSLTDENRTIVKYGLDRINSGRRKSLRSLYKAISLGNITSENIAFGIAPHINAAGRMASAGEAVELLMSEDREVIDQKVSRLLELNGERKQRQENAYKRCMEMLSGNENFIILSVEDIHEGIAGIVAGKIKEKTNRPVIIVTPSGEGLLKGTGRSVEGIDIHHLLKKHSNLFIRFGGHKSACGFLMEETRLSALRTAVNEDMSILLEEDDTLFKNHISWDMAITPGEVTLELAKRLDKLEPFGQGNPRPAFKLCNLRLSNVSFMGQLKNHARFSASDDSGERVDCVLFSDACEKKSLLLGNRPVDIIGSISIQRWHGRESVQLVVEEMI